MAKRDKNSLTPIIITVRDNFHETSPVLIDFLQITHIPKLHENLKNDSVAVPGQGRLIYTYTFFQSS